MLEIVLQPRIIGSKDWATVLFVLSFLLIAVTRGVFETRFADFSKLAYNDKYIKIYRDSANLMNCLQLVFLSFK